MSANKTPSLGKMIDSLYELRAKRLALAREVDELKTTEAAQKKSIMELLENQDSKSTSGKLATASITTAIVPRATDWAKLNSYIKKHGALELLHQRISTVAWREAVEAGKKIPGVEAVEIRDLSLSKSQRG